LTIQNSVGDALTWTFYNQLGQVVLQTSSNGQISIIDINQLQGGGYIVRATDSKGIRFAGYLLIE
ncbi:MAG: hypothetical protein ABR95_06490, partial [Sphingobacteriales bacterium BACL12 MAG-120813-bin55]